MGKSMTVGVDLAKSVFEIAISKEPGRVSQRRRVSRSQMLRLLAEQPPSMVLMEACGSAHYWGRVFESQGHQVRLLPAHHVSRYRLGNKTDRADVEALLEAGRNERISPVPIKSVAQQTLTALHRLRCEWVATRTARLNGLRGLLREIGIVIPQGAKHVLAAVGDALGTGQVPQELHIPVMACCEEIRGLEGRIRQVERQLAAIAKESCAAESLLSVPGIGLLTATAMIGWVGSAGRFRSGRRYASFLGLTPREFSSGNTRRLGAISKRGDTYLRTLLIHGARAVLIAAKRAKNLDRLRLWALQLEKRRGHNRAATALANKLARIAWAVWSKATFYQPSPLSPAAKESN